MRIQNSLFALIVIFHLAGCDQARQKIADTLAPPTPIEMATRVDSLTDEGRAEQAIEQGRGYLKANKDPQGVVDKALKRAYMSASLIPGSDSVSSNNDNSKDLLKKEATSPSQSSPMPAKVESQSSKSVSVDGASVTTGPNGTVVRAGDAIVIMPK